MSYQVYLDSLQRFGIHLGLERIRALLSRLGDPQNTFRAVHVAGTNGKGSVTAYVSHVLHRAGIRTGRYTSPHLIDWNERIWIAGEPIAEPALAASLCRVHAAAATLDPALGAPTQFEIFTAAAFVAFAEAQIAIAVIEVGLGGRLDATNVLEAPLATAITGIGFDHTDRLGDTLAAIATEKAGILKAGTPLVVAPLAPDARQVVAERAAALKVPVVVAWPARRLGPGTAEWEGLRYTLPLAGDVQLQNSATALALCRVLQERGIALSEAHLVEGIAETRWPGRCQWLTPRLLVDGAHNPEAALHLRHTVDAVRSGEAVRWVVGIMASKQADQILAHLVRPGDRFVAVPVPDAEFWQPSELVRLATDLGAAAEAEPFFEAALARDWAGLTVLCGSLYLVGAVLRLYRER
jgi:dihydrofolate synthase/folylpolyglutamate synthase